jgi:hypothetical protein
VIRQCITRNLINLSVPVRSGSGAYVYTMPSWSALAKAYLHSGGTHRWQSECPVLRPVTGPATSPDARPITGVAAVQSRDRRTSVGRLPGKVRSPVQFHV